MYQSYGRPRSYLDSVAEKRRKKLIIKSVIFGFLVLMIMSGVGYFVFFSSFFNINEVNIEGVSKLKKEELIEKINKNKKKRFLGFFNIENNLLFFNDEITKAQLSESFPILKDISIDKDYFHKININLNERKSIGTWCFDAISEMQECRYFDEDGFTWGTAIRSSGSILITIEDERKSKAIDHISKEVLDPILKANKEISDNGIKINKITIPEKGLESFRVYSLNGYYIIFSWLEPIMPQVESLEAFLDQRRDSDPSLTYVDLRIPNRIYFK